MNEPDWRWLYPAFNRDHVLLATAFALLISFSVSLALLSWATPTTTQSRSTDLERSIEGWQLRPTRTHSETDHQTCGSTASAGARADRCPADLHL